MTESDLFFKRKIRKFVIFLLFRFFLVPGRKNILDGPVKWTIPMIRFVSTVPFRPVGKIYLRHRLPACMN